MVKVKIHRIPQSKIYIAFGHTRRIYSSLFVKKNDSIEKIKKNVTKLQKNKLGNLNKYTT